jgi:dephospho-CoA kinase
VLRVLRLAILTAHDGFNTSVNIMSDSLIKHRRGADKRPFVIALTGGIASGKTTVSNLFHQHYGVCVVDADVIARDVVAIGQPALALIAEHFGILALQQDGALNRTYIKQRIFNDVSERTWLNGLLHPLIHQQIQKQIAACTSDYALAVIPLLVETGVPDFVDFVLVVDCSVEVQYQRISARDGVDFELAQSIIAAQATREARLAMANAIIANELETSAQQLAQQVSHWHQVFYRLSSS